MPTYPCPSSGKGGQLPDPNSAAPAWQPLQPQHFLNERYLAVEADTITLCLEASFTCWLQAEVPSSPTDPQDPTRQPRV